MCLNSFRQLRELDVDACVVHCSKLRQGDKFTSSIYNGATATVTATAGPLRLWVFSNNNTFHFTFFFVIFSNIYISTGVLFVSCLAFKTIFSEDIKKMSRVEW